MLAIDGTARFVSDIHLRAERPDITGRFFSFLDDCAGAGIQALFILGDLFEYWIGDDDLDDEFNREVASRLVALTRRGTQTYFISGNRDFLIGTDFAREAGIALLPELTKVGAGDTAILLLHGDTLCTDDVAYQDFRRLVRSSAWQSSFLGQPLAQRRAEVARLRQRSAAAMQGKSAAIMDVNAQAVSAALRENDCASLIHGHTHRPADHVFELKGEVCTRRVLSDWDSGRGDALEVDAAGVRRLDYSN